MYGIMRPGNLGLTFMRTAVYDVITESHICGDIQKEFGVRYLRGSVIFVWNEVEVYCIEHLFRSFLKDKEINNAVEIGTNLGVSALFLAHYAYHLTTIDIIPRTEPLPLWDYFGISHKIDYIVVMDEDVKKEILSKTDFDFAFIDGSHSLKGIKADFELVKPCGRVLMACYGQHRGTTDFVNSLPKEEVIFKKPLAYWEKR